MKNEMIKNFFIRLEEVLRLIVTNKNKLNMTGHISGVEELIKIVKVNYIKFIDKNNTNEESLIEFNFILSHVEYIRHYLDISAGKNINSAKIMNDMEENILLGKRIIYENNNILTKKSKMSFNLNNIGNGTIAKRKNNPKKERRLSKDQNYLKINPAFLNLLTQTWIKAVENKYHSKKIFISYAWTTEESVKEDWTQLFVLQLAEHLALAGMQVFLDRFQGGTGRSLDQFMDKLKKVDHVLFISSRTMRDKLRNSQSGVSQEYKKIIEYVRQCLLDDIPLAENFVIPVLLNIKNYSPKEFAPLAEISMCDQGYLVSLQQLIFGLYDIGSIDKVFSTFWDKEIHFFDLNYAKRGQKNLLRTSKITEWNNSIMFHDDLYVPRPKLQQQLHVYLNVSDNNTNMVLNIIIFCGLAGSGKTTFAKAYYFDPNNNTKYKTKAWFRADRILDDYRTYATALGIIEPSEIITEESLVEKVKCYLEQNPDWLLIYDNATEAVQRYLPKKGGVVIITSRSRNWLQQKKINIESLEHDEAVQLVRQRINRNDSEIPQLVESLSNLALPLVYASAYISLNSTTAEYLMLLKTCKNELLLEDNGIPLQSFSEDAYDSVARTWQLNLKNIGKKCPDAIMLMYCISYLYAEEIPEDLVKQLVWEDHKNSSVQLCFNKAISFLNEYSLVNRNLDRKTISIHRLVQQIIRFSIPDEKFILLKIIRIVQKLFSRDNRFKKQFETNQELLPHVDVLLDHIQNCNLEQINCEPSLIALKIARACFDIFTGQASLGRERLILMLTHLNNSFAIELSNDSAEVICKKLQNPLVPTLYAHALYQIGRSYLAGIDHQDQYQECLNCFNLAIAMRCCIDESITALGTPFDDSYNPNEPRPMDSILFKRSGLFQALIKYESPQEKVLLQKGGGKSI